MVRVRVVRVRIRVSVIRVRVSLSVRELLFHKLSLGPVPSVTAGCACG